MKKSVYSVSPSARAIRLDLFISLRSGLTRSHVLKLIKQDLVKVNSEPQKASYNIRGGDLVEMTLPDELEGVLIPEDIPVEILWEDEHLLVVNKPPDMVIYPAAGNSSGTLLNALVSKNRKLSSVGAPMRPGIVHRLDKDTSGVMVIAKDNESHHDLVNQFKEREVEKYYMALLFGRLKKDSGEITSAIGRSLSNRKKMSVRTSGGKEAITRFEVIKRFRMVTMVKVRILTGRTHQIRVHFASEGSPVLGDKTYGKKTSVDTGCKIIKFGRQMLHACSLKLRHPVTGEVMEFKAPLPEDMETAIAECEEICQGQ